MSKKQVSELFAPPIGLEPISISGFTFHTSDKLKEKFVYAFSKSSKGKHITNDIERLVKNDEIIPCFKSKGILSFLKRKLSRDSADKNIAAFYDVDDKKVIVIIDNNTTIFGTASNNTIASTTMHECVHLAAGKNLTGFVNIFSPHLNSYYSEFFSDYFRIKNIDSRKIDELINFLTVYERRGPRFVNSNLPQYYKFLDDVFREDSQLNVNEFNSLLTNMIVACKLLIVSFPSLARNARRFSMIFTALNRAYERAFRQRNDYTTPIQ